MESRQLEQVAERTINLILCDSIDIESTYSPRFELLYGIAKPAYERFLSNNDPSSLALSIVASRQALWLCPETDIPTRYTLLSHLSSSLSSRYAYFGRLEDLEESLKYLREALPLTSNKISDRLATLHRLNTSLRTLYEQSRRVEDMEEAIYYQQLSSCGRNDGIIVMAASGMDLSGDSGASRDRTPVAQGDADLVMPSVGVAQEAQHGFERSRKNSCMDVSEDDMLSLCDAMAKFQAVY